MRSFVFLNALFIGLVILKFTANASGYPVQDSGLLKLKWSYKTNGRLFSTPLVEDNKIFIGSADSMIYAVNQSDGNLLWKYKTGGQVNSTGAYSKQLNRVYFLCGDGKLYCLNAVNGKKIWAYSTAGEMKYDYWDYFLSSPIIIENKMICFGSGDGHIYALDPVKGSLIWKYKTGDIVHSTPLVHENMIFTGSFDGYLYALDLNGKLKWKFKTLGERYFPKGEIQFKAAASDSTIYICSRDYNVYALHYLNGRVFWVFHEPGSWTSIPVFKNNKLYVSTSDSHRLLVIDAGSGSLLDNRNLHLNSFNAVTWNGESGFIGAMDGRLYRLELVDNSWSSVFHTSSFNNLSHEFFDAQDNLKLDELIRKYNNNVFDVYESFYSLGSIMSSVVTNGENIYFTSVDGYLYSVSREP